MIRRAARWLAEFGMAFATFAVLMSLLVVASSDRVPSWLMRFLP
jgi:hypothetical protein